MQHPASSSAPGSTRKPTAWLLRVAGWLLVVAWLSGAPVEGQGRPEMAEEYSVKAAFLYNFSKFVEWPEAGAGSGEPQPLNVCIYGQDPFGETLDAIRDKPVRNRILKIRHCQSLGETTGSQILFIASSERGRLDEILKRIQGIPILTVSDSEDFTEQGGMIGMFTQEGRIRFAINEKAARAAGLRIGSQLLKLAQRLIE